MASGAGIKRLPIEALGPGTSNYFVVGIIIAKQNPRKIQSRVGSSEERGVCSFTIRDSPYDFINVNCWGSLHFIETEMENYNIGDVVEISNARVTHRKPDQDEKFSPTVTSPCQLTVSENQNSLKLYGGDDCSAFEPLLNLTTKPPTDFYTLADIHSNGSSMRGESVNLLAVVRDIGPIRTIKTKDGRSIICRDITIMDQTSSGLPVQLWNAATAHRADSWEPRNTVLFLVDMRVEWNAFKRGMVASDGLRTIITENPDTSEAMMLRAFARTAPVKPSAILEQLASTIPDPGSIRQVMTVQQVFDRTSVNYAEAANTEDKQFTALIYCLVTHLDLDGTSRITATRCSRCQLPIDGICINLECPVGSGAEIAAPDTVFDIRMRLTDHTGSLENCRLTGTAAERVLNCTVNEFLAMKDDSRTALKWCLLMERCAARIMVLRPSSEQRRPLVSVLACSVANPVEVAAHIPIF
ncbi:meiosis-specific with OB domain-containing protein [Schistocerca americana]|uniref:meiosis-specific with OB domain-containing protein n=1 Tax=Schistocerca americana TaxID=7009 RepID=UPI001F4F21EB|nr:meiosis-specific with OB domain-containing protein [Schistocerca americana]XP_047111897.1 meiosis-specific with OB domain-containing protein [Schistocerca piceifrons]